MSRKSALLLGLSGLLLLVLLAFYNGQEKVAQDLTYRGEAILAENSLAWAHFDIDGRDLYLRGEAPSNKSADQALHLLQALDGINRVIDESTIQPANNDTAAKPTSDSPWSSSVKAH